MAGISLRAKAYKELKELGCEFGYFYINPKKKNKRNTIKAKDVHPFPKDENQLRQWAEGKNKLLVHEILKVPKGAILGPKYKKYIYTEPYNVVVGLKDSQIIAFDCDVKNGKNGYEALKRIFRTAFSLRGRTIDFNKYFNCVNETPNGGYHIYFKIPKGLKPNKDFDFGIWGPEYAGVEMKTQGLMFSGASVYTKVKEVKILDPQPMQVKDLIVEGTYQLLRWEGIQELPEEVYEYLEFLNKQFSRISINRRKVTFAGKIKSSSDKLYANILNGEVEEGARFKTLQSLAGYLVATSKTYSEALKKFTEYAETRTNPPYPQDSRSEWNALLNFLQNLWISNYGSLEAVNQQYENKKKLITEGISDIERIIKELSQHGLHFIRDEITDEEFLESEAPKRRIPIGKDLKAPMILLDYYFDFHLKKKASIKEKKYILKLGKKFFTPFNDITDFWENIEEYEDSTPVYDFFHAFVSDEYPPALKEQIINYIIKWFVILYWNSLARPKARNSAMLIFTGNQQIGKGYFIDSLFPANLYASVSQFPKDSRIREFKYLQISKILIHWDDAIQNFEQKEWERIKPKITAPYVNWNPKYKNYSLNKPQRASHIATTNDEYFLKDPANKIYFPVKVQKYDRQRDFVEPKVFLGIIKYLAKNVYPDWISWNSQEQNFFNELSKRHRKNTEVIEALFEYFDFIKAGSKKEAKQIFYNKYKDELNSKRLMFATLTMLRTFLINGPKIHPKRGEIKNSLHKLGYKIVNSRIKRELKRGYYVVPKSTEPYHYIPNRYIIE